MGEYLITARIAIFDHIRSSKLDPGDFELSEDGQVLTLRYKDSPLQFSFKKAASNHDRLKYRYVTFMPKKGIVSNYASNFKPVTFNRCLTIFKEKFLKEQIKWFIQESNAIDPWLPMKSKKNLFETLSNEDESTFSPSEKQEVLMALARFEKMVSEKFKLAEGEMKAMHKALDYLREGTERMNKRDWKAIATRVIYDIGISISSNLAFQIPASFWSIVTEAFKILSLPALPI